MSATTTTIATKKTDIRVDLYRDRQGQWRWRSISNGHTLADSGQGYSRRLDCLRGAMRVTGVREITWLGWSDGFDYGQSSLGRTTVEFFVWHKLVQDGRP